MPRGLKPATHTTGTLHHTVHFLAFGGVALGAVSWARSSAGRVIVTSTVIGLGALLELLQHYFYGSAYEWKDLRSDSYGAIVGSLCLSAIIAVARGASSPDRLNNVDPVDRPAPFLNIEGDCMSIKSSIISQIEQLAAEEDTNIPPLTDDLVLLNLGLDSLAIAVLVARLEEALGVDPFTESDDVYYPVTLGDFIRSYEEAARSR